MDIQDFLKRAGFETDPFASTNSASEERLSDYFVPPPYFESVKGDPKSPKSNVVFAPRGSGKTAQRRMIEQLSQEPGRRLLCLTYENFAPIVAQPTLAAHHLAICRLLVIAILARLESEPDAVDKLNDHQKAVVKIASTTLLDDLSIAEYKSSVESVKTLGDKASDFWRKYGGPVAAGIQILLKKAGFDDVSVPSDLEAQVGNRKSASLQYMYSSLLEVARSLDWDSVYFLIDRVDETASTTSNAGAASAAIHELIADLNTIEAPGAAFKFFLWDQMRDPMRDAGLRSDRLEVLRLDWTVDELETMLGRRLAAHSERRVNSFNDFLADEVGIDVHRLLAHLSGGSPRDMIRMARAIIAAHTRSGSSNGGISRVSVMRGIHSMATEFAEDAFPRYRGDFSRIGGPSFTLNYLANDVFKITTTSARNKVQAWLEAGAVKRLGERANPGKRPLHLYGFSDPRIVIAAGTPGSVEDVLTNWITECGECGHFTVASEEHYDCSDCGNHVTRSDAGGLLEACRVASEH